MFRKLGESLETAVYIALDGMRMWAQPPLTLGTEVVIDTEWAPRRLAAIEAARASRGELYVRRYANLTPPDKPGDRERTIHLKCRRSVQGQWFEANITVDTVERIIVDASPGLLHEGHVGSGAIGVALFSLPVTVPLSPLLLLMNRLYWLQEGRYGMSRHAIALLSKLRGKLEPEVEVALVEGLRKQWEFTRKYRRDVNIAEAMSLLKSASRLEQRFRGDGTMPPFRAYSWTDSDNVSVASCQITEGRITMSVLDSTFEGSVAHSLLGCYRETKCIDITEEMVDANRQVEQQLQEALGRPWPSEAISEH